MQARIDKEITLLKNDSSGRYKLLSVIIPDIIANNNSDNKGSGNRADLLRDEFSYNNIAVIKKVETNNSSHVMLKIQLFGEIGTVYDGESWVLQLILKNYPFESPITTFIGTPPVHEHVYSNGHICFSLFYDDWSPSITISTILSELSSLLRTTSSPSRIKTPPSDDFSYCNSHPYGSDPKLTKFHFHHPL